MASPVWRNLVTVARWITLCVVCAGALAFLSISGGVRAQTPRQIELQVQGAVNSADIVRLKAEYTVLQIQTESLKTEVDTFKGVGIGFGVVLGLLQALQIIAQFKERKG